MASRNLMKTVFGLDNGFMRAAERVFDLLVLNLLFVLTASLLVTAGVAKMALYRSLVDLKERGRVPILATYWGHVKANWRKGLALGLVGLALTVFTVFDLLLIRGQEGLPFQVLAVLAYGVLMLTLVVHLYLYPLATRYQMTLSELYVKALLLAGLNGLWTLAFLAVIGIIFLALQLSFISLILGLSLLMVIGLAALGYGHMVVMEKIFEKYQSVLTRQLLC